MYTGSKSLSHSCRNFYNSGFTIQQRIIHSTVQIIIEK